MCNLPKGLYIICLIFLSLGAAAQDELNLWPGPATAGALRGNILGVTYEFAAVPTAATATIDNITHTFALGDLIRVATNSVYIKSVTGWAKIYPVAVSSVQNYYSTEYKSTLVPMPQHLQYYGANATGAALTELSIPFDYRKGTIALYVHKYRMYPYEHYVEDYVNKKLIIRPLSQVGYNVIPQGAKWLIEAVTY